MARRGCREMKADRSNTRLLKYMQGNWLKFTVGGVMSILSESGIQLGLALLLRGMVNASVGRDVRLLLMSLGQYGLLIFLGAALLPLGRRLCAAATEMAVAEWRNQTFDHVQNLPLASIEGRHSQDLVSRLTADIDVARRFLGEELVDFVAHVASALISAAFIIMVDARFVAIPLFLVVMSAVVNRVSAVPLQRTSKASQARLAEMHASVKDVVQGQCGARGWGVGDLLLCRVDEKNDALRANNLKLVGLQSTVGVISNFLGSANFLGVVALGSYMILQQELTPGEVVAVVQFSQTMVRPFRNAGSVWSALQQTLAAAERAFELLDSPPEKLRSSGSVPQDDAAVVFQNVSFSYGDVPALKGVSFSVPHGKTAAVIGESGGGKSTIFKLLLGLYQAGGGSIAVNGKDIGEYSLPELRSLTALVPQDAWLFTGTIYDNITCGREDVGMAEVQRAATAANAHDFIASLPDGYETEVGEHGSKLSGGQRQRIAIARAFLKDAPILLLDEATSSIDNEAESLVWAGLESLMAGRTTLLIAHRLTTARKADVVFVVTDGQIVEQGTHAELLRVEGTVGVCT